MSESDTEAEREKRDRSPSFPYITLTEAVERVEQLNRGSRGALVRLRDAARDWGLSGTSSTTLRVAAALLAFGLIEDEGSGSDRKIRISEMGRRILFDKRPGAKEKSLRECALSPGIISKYLAIWPNGRPDDAHAISDLTLDDGFTQDAARKFLRVYDDAVRYAASESKEDRSVKQRNEGTITAQINAEHPQNEITESGSIPQSTDKNNAASVSNDWLLIRVGKNTVVRIIVDGKLDAKGLERLIKLLEVQKTILEEEAQDDLLQDSGI